MSVTAGDAALVVRTLLCRGLTPAETQQILDAMVPATAEPGTTVFKEGDRASGLLVLVSGTIEILKQGATGREESLASVDAPAVLGEMSLVTEQPHSATGRARTACEFRLLTRSQFDRLLDADSLAAYKLVRTLAAVIARRLHRINEKVVELAQQPTPAPVEELATFKEKLFTEWSF